jgi:hypothetical protein
LKIIRENIGSGISKVVSTIFLILIMLNNILIPEMKRFHPNSEIENNAAGLIEILIEEAVDSDLYETDEHDDSSDNLVDSIQKFVCNQFNLEFNSSNAQLPLNQSLYPFFKLAKGYQFLDTPPPKF